MEIEPVEASQPAVPNPLWRPTQVIVMAGVCLVVGGLVGYLLRGSAPAAVAVAPSATMSAPAAPAAMPGTASSQPAPTAADIKRMVNTKSEALLADLKKDPNNAETLNHLGMLHKAAHEFKEAEGYFQKSLDVDPKNASVRTDLATCKYVTGDADGAIAELQKALTYDPKHAGALMNLGIIQYKAKHDAKAAIADWEKLLKTNPNFPQKDLVLHMIEQAKRAGENPEANTKG
jgi:cytochrome c-type biogenesis protein CcmH/NrfG